MAANSVKDSQVVQLLPALGLAVTLSVLAVPLRALRGLRCYYAAGATSADVAGRGKKVKARRGGGASKKEDDYDLGGAEALVVAPLSVRQAGQLTYQGAFENLVLAALFALCTNGVGQGAERLLGWPPSPMPGMAAYGAACVALAMLAQVDLLSATTSPANKAMAVFWGLAGFAAALALHVLQPGGGTALAWDTQRAAAAVGPSITHLIRSLGSRALRGGTAPIPEIAMSATTLQLLLAVVAAVIAVMLFAPALRYVQAYWLQMSPPEWAADYIQTPVLPTAGLALHLLLPALTSLLWVRPMSQELLGLSDAALARTQAVALLATAAAMAANLRTLLQRYLDRGLTGWHQLKHGSRAARGNRDEKRSLGEVIRVHCQATNFLLGKVAVQSLAPAVLYLGLGLLLLNSALRPEAASGVAAETQALVQTCVGFVAAWTGACWFAYGAGILWLFRTGVMQP